MNRIENSLIRDITTDYGGAFTIYSNIDLFVKDVIIINVKTTSYLYTNIGDYVGGAGIIFMGNNFNGSGLCCSILSANYRSLLYMYSAAHTIHLNDTSIDNGTCYDYSVLLGRGKCFAKSMNCTHLKAMYSISTLHFGFHPVSYYCTNIYAANNTGKIIFGHSCSTNSEQISNSIILLYNSPIDGILGFWTFIHRITNSYMIGNAKNTLIERETCTVKFDNCYHDGISNIHTETNIRTSHEIFITISSQNCLTFVPDTCVRIKTCQCRGNSLTYLFIILFLFIES
jgi:hypothetical protein